MDPLDRIALSESLRSFGVTEVGTKDFYFVSPHPVDELLNFTAECLSRPLDLLVSEQGIPSHFYLDGLDRLTVVFSSRFVALTERLLRLDQTIFTEFPINLSEAVAFQVIAEFCLLQGNAVMAAICHMKSQILQGNVSFTDTRAIFGAGSDLWSMDQRPVDAIYVTDFFFGLAHEIGHAIQRNDIGGNGPPWCSDGMIERYIADVASMSYGDAGITFRMFGPSATLDCARLRIEAGADIEGCRLLTRAAPRMIQKHGEPGSTFDFKVFLAGIYVNFSLFSFLSGCSRAAALMCNMEQQKAVELVQQPIAFAVRQFILQDHLPIIAAECLDSGSDGIAATFGEGPRDVARIDPKVARFFKGLWTEAHQHMTPFTTGTNTGLLNAMQFINQLKDEDVIAVNHEYRKMQGAGDITFVENRIIELARSMQLPDRTLEDFIKILRP